MIASPEDLTSLGVRLGDDHVRLAARPSLRSWAARSAEMSVERRRPSSSTCWRDLALELLDAVGQLRALAPDGLEAVRDVVHHAMNDGLPALVGTARAKLLVPDLRLVSWPCVDSFLEQAPDQVDQEDVE